MALTPPEMFQKAGEHFAAGRLEDAEKWFLKVLEEVPDHAKSYMNLGIVRIHGKDFAGAAEALAKAAALDGDNPDVQRNFGAALMELGRFGEAATAFKKALQALTDEPLAKSCAMALEKLCKRGLDHLNGGRGPEAEKIFREVLDIEPDHPAANHKLAVLLARSGRMDAALSCLRKAVAAAPDFTEAHYLLGLFLRNTGKAAEAVAAFRRVADLEPGHKEVHQSLARALEDLGRAEEARAAYDRAGSKIKKALVLPYILGTPEDIARDRDRMLSEIKALDKEGPTIADPFREVEKSNFLLAYHGLNDLELESTIADFYLKACPSLGWRAPHCKEYQAPRGERRLRVGFLSAFLRPSHTIGKLKGGLIAAMPKDRLEITVFHSGDSGRGKQAFDWDVEHEVHLPEDLARARFLVSEAKLDVLYYTDIGMDAFTYFLAFARLAPVQCVSWGHPTTSGIPNMDYFISAPTFDAEGAEDQYREKLVRLPHVAMSYSPPPPPPGGLASRAELGLPEDRTLYVCAQTLFKIHPDFDKALGEILAQDEKALLVFIKGDHDDWEKALRARFGFPEDGLVFLPRLDWRSFLGLSHEADALIDAFHYSGGNTTLEAFSVDAPIVTLPSAYLRGRFTAGLYTQMGMTDLIANSPEHYVDLAVRLANDKAWKEEMRTRLAARFPTLTHDPEAPMMLADFFEKAVPS